MPKPYFAEPNKIQEIIKVNHAGEFGAQQIYAAQIKFLRSDNTKKILSEMLLQELRHLNYFEEQIKSGRGQPTILLPVWKIFGYTLGAITGLMGHKYTMLTTEAVEEVIVQHYQDQINYLQTHAANNPILPQIQEFQKDEAEHINIAVDKEYNSHFSLIVIKHMVKTICHFAIYLSKKV